MVCPESLLSVRRQQPTATGTGSLAIVEKIKYQQPAAILIEQLQNKFLNDFF